MIASVYDDRQCALGEGPLWHPERGQLYWFDILAGRLLTVENGTQRHWQFDEMVSAAGWTGRDTLLIASETRLLHFDLDSGTSEPVCMLEANTPATRSNDGRADPQGGFWIGTMGKQAEPGAGAIYRYYRGELRRLYPGISIPNSICFTPGGGTGYYADTSARQIMRQRLDGDGWPKGAPQVFVDLRAEGLNPDGSVVAADGTLWNAQWGAARIAGYSPEGRFDTAYAIPGLHSSCPAFGGPDFTTMYCTTARQGLNAATLQAHPENGMTFMIENAAQALSESRVIL